MLGNLKSKYIVKIIFSLIKEKVKLQIVRYNKSLQIKLELNIINYKIFSGKFIVNKNIGKSKKLKQKTKKDIILLVFFLFCN